MTIRKKIIISTLTISIAIGGIIYFIIIPTVNDIKKIRDEVHTERVDLEKKYLRGQLLKKMISDFERIKPEKDKLASTFIIKGQELEFITALEQIASLNNLEQKLQLQQLTDDLIGQNFYTALPLKTSISGKFIDTLKYLNNLDQLNYYFNIKSITINTEEEDDLVNADFDGEIYILTASKKE